ncbi:toxoflavin synthase [Candidatus Magnetomoraceae bacterium gMMP-15]
MSTNYDDIFLAYKIVTEELAISKYVQEFSILSLLGDVKGKIILDLACGEGRFARKIMQRGARRLVGVDISERMVNLAKIAEREHPFGIEYIICDVTRLKKIGTFDMVTAIFLFDYASTKEALLTMCQTAYDNLQSSGKLIGTINSTPIYSPQKSTITRKYGYIIKSPLSLHEGDPVEYSFFTSELSFNIIKYHWNKETYEWAFREAGFSEIKWKTPTISQKGIEKYGVEFWQDYLKKPNFVCFECS